MPTDICFGSIGEVTNDEKTNLLWRKFNNVANVEQQNDFNQQLYPYKDNFFSQNIINKDIPQIIYTKNTETHSDLSGYINFCNSYTPSGTFDPSYISVIQLDKYFESLNKHHDFSLNFSIFGYDYLEFRYKQKLRNVVNGNNQTFYATDPSNSVDGNILTNLNAVNLLRNIIPYNYNTSLKQPTYKYNSTLYNSIKYHTDPSFCNNNTFFTSTMYSEKDRWLLDDKSGFIEFYGWTKVGNKYILNKFCSESEWFDNSGSKSPPFFSYIRYVGEMGLNGGNSGSIDSWSDLSLTNLDISNNLRFVKDTSSITIVAPSDLSASYILTLPKEQGKSGQVLALDESKNLIFTNQSNNCHNNCYNSGGNSLSNNLQFKNSFNPISHLVIDKELYDLSNIFFNTIKPCKSDAKVWVNFNFSYKCSYAFKERINFYICRDSCDNYIKTDTNIGSKNFTGGLIENYSSSFIDIPGNATEHKYYLKFQLENNNSQEPQGIIKFNSITLIVEKFNDVIPHNSFYDPSYLVTDTEHYDLSNIFFNTITPCKPNTPIFVDINFLYKCSYAFEERINIYIYRDTSINPIKVNKNIGSKNFTGGLIGKYVSSFIDIPETIGPHKYYITFQLENNNSNEPQGIYQFNSINLIEY